MTDVARCPFVPRWWLLIVFFHIRCCAWNFLLTKVYIRFKSTSCFRMVAVYVIFGIKIKKTLRIALVKSTESYTKIQRCRDNKNKEKNPRRRETNTRTAWTDGEEAILSLLSVFSESGTQNHSWVNKLPDLPPPPPPPQVCRQRVAPASLFCPARI